MYLPRLVLSSPAVLCGVEPHTGQIAGEEKQTRFHMNVQYTQALWVLLLHLKRTQILGNTSKLLRQDNAEETSVCYNAHRCRQWLPRIAITLTEMTRCL